MVRVDAQTEQEVPEEVAQTQPLATPYPTTNAGEPERFDPLQVRSDDQ